MTLVNTFVGTISTIQTERIPIIIFSFMRLSFIEKNIIFNNNTLTWVYFHIDNVEYVRVIKEKLSHSLENHISISYNIFPNNPSKLRLHCNTQFLRFLDVNKLNYILRNF